VSTRDWEAGTYDRVSDVQAEWAKAVLDRLPLNGDETVLDAGCGTGRVTRELERQLPRGRVIAVDSSPAMIEKAREALSDRSDVIVSDLAELELEQPVDVVFSTATFHWIPDHDRLFRRLHAALRPGGRLVAQQGGAGNVARFLEIVDRVAAEEPFARAFRDWRLPYWFATPEETAKRLRTAGFESVDCSLEPADARPDAPREFVSTVCLGQHLERLSPEVRDEFLDAVLAQTDGPLVLDYVRLNIDARRAR
jgi:trans-aconitate 2-methyltransferase